MQDKKYIALYCRESTKAQAKDGYNLVEQEKKGKAYIELEEFEEPIKVFSEYGASAKTLNRPKIKELFEEIKQNKVKRIVVYKLDRIVRRLSNLHELLQLLDKYDIDFISVREKIDTATAFGRLFINLVVLFAEWEQDNISERTIEGLMGGASLGNYIMGGKPPFGYHRYKETQIVDIKGVMKEVRKVGLKENKEEMKVVKEIFKMALEGKSVMNITILINDNEYLKKINRCLGEHAIRNILNSKIYCGIMPFKNENYLIDVPKVLTEEEYVNVHRMLRRRSKIKVNDYIYKNKIYCSCGALCVQESTNKMNANGLQIYLYYKCSACKKRISEKDINNYVLPTVISNFIKYKKDDHAKTLEEKMKRIEELKENIYQLYKSSSITSNTYINAMILYESDFKKIQEDYSSYINDFQLYFSKMKYKDKAKLVTQNINSIIINMELKTTLVINKVI